MFPPIKLKCPKCQQQILKKAIKASSGKCNNCGYMMVGTIMSFVPKPKTTMEILNDMSV